MRTDQTTNASTGIQVASLRRAVAKQQQAVPISLIAGWRPMSSAPKDGNEVDLFAGGRRWTDCHWHCGEWLYWDAVEGEPTHRRVVDPTHWMRVANP